jgi:O-antigen/teichoic acid export membrane protein
VLNVLFPIVTAPYISRVLGVENIGVVRFVITCVGYFVLFAALGISYYGVRELAKFKDNQEKCSQIFSSLFVIILCSTLVMILFFFLSINLIPEFKEQRLLFSLYGITLYFVPISMDWYFQAKENFRMIAIRSFVVKMLALTSLFIFVRQRSDIIPYVFISTFSIVGNQIWNLCYAYKTGLRIKLSNIELRHHIKPMFVFLGTNVAVSVFVMLDTVMLGFLSSYNQVGYYTSPNLIVSVWVGFFTAVNTVLLPRLSFNNAQKGNTENVVLLQKTFDLNALLIVPMVIGLCLASARFVPLFFGSEFIGSIVPMQILSFKIIAVMFNSFFVVNILMVLGHEKKLLFAVVCTALLSFTLNLLFIPRYGAVGTAAVSLIAESFEAGLNLYFVYKFTRIKVRWNALGTAAIFALPLFVLYYFCDKFIAQDVTFLFVFVCFSGTVYFTLQLLGKNYLVYQVMEIGINKLNKYRR